MRGYWAQPQRNLPQSAAASLFSAPATSASPSYGEIDNSSRASFVRTAWPYMLEASGGRRDTAEMMLAAAISENGAVGTGKPFWANNFYGIKGRGPAGSVTADTHEIVDGRRVDMPDAFAAYHTPQEGFRGFFNFLRENPRYEESVRRYDESGDAERLFRDVTEAGYATDKAWPDKILNIRQHQVAPIVADLPVPELPQPPEPRRSGPGPLSQRPFEQGGDDIFSQVPKGTRLVVIPPDGEPVDIPIGAEFDWGGQIAPDGRGDDDMPLGGDDCSSFIANLIAHLTGDKVRLPALTDAMADELPIVEPGDEQEGDLLFSKYEGQGPIDWGHVSMLLDKQGATPDKWMALEQSTAPGLTTGRPGIDIRRADHAIDQGGEMIVRRLPRDRWP